MNCQQLLSREIQEFIDSDGSEYTPHKPEIVDEMDQLRYNACTEGYESENTTRVELIEFFGQELYDEVALCGFEYEHNL
jgi:hypothetical protein